LIPGHIPGTLLPRPEVDGHPNITPEEFDLVHHLLPNTPESGNPNVDDSIPTEVESDPDDNSETLSELSATALTQLQNYHRLPDVDVQEEENVGHTESTIGSQLAEVKEQMSKRFPPSLVRKFSKSLSQLILLAVGLNYDTNLESVVTRCIAFLDAMLDDGLVMNLHDVLMSYVADNPLPNEYQGRTVAESYAVENQDVGIPEASSPTAIAVWETLRKGIFTKHLSYVIGTSFAFFTCKIQNVEFSHPLHDNIMKHANAETINGVDLIDHVLKVYNWISTVGVACFEQRSLQPAILNSGALSTCHQSFYEVKQWFIDVRRSGCSTMEERQIQFVKIETVYNTLVKLIKLERDKFTTLQSSSLIRDVSVLYNDVKDFVLKIDAVKVACGIHIHGAPKVGKSFITADIHEQICMARGVAYRQSDCAEMNAQSQYQDELTNSTQCITLNEASAVKEKFAKSLETAYTTALALVDPVPFHPNRSNIEDKAKITCQHISVVSTGNTEEPFIHIAKTPGAWCRRYRSLYMKVKPEFADENGRFDSRKCDGSHNYHKFDLYEIVYSENGSKSRQYYKWKDGDSRNLETFELMELLRELAITHFEDEDRLEESRKKAKKQGCLKCKRLAHFCACKIAHDTKISAEDIKQVEASVYSGVPQGMACPKSPEMGGLVSACMYDECGRCKYCGGTLDDDENPEDTSENTPEAGMVKDIMSFGTSIAVESAASWFNPFIKFRWLFSIDNATTESIREDILEELSYIPDTWGCKLLSLIPESQLVRHDGTPSFLGKMKTRFLKMVAAERQVLLPLRMLVKRAFTLACIVFLICTAFVFSLDYFGFERHKWQFTEQVTHTFLRVGWLPMFPEWSDYVLQNRIDYIDKGISVPEHVDSQLFYSGLYRIQQLLGKIYYYWYYWETTTTYVIVYKMSEWWHFPLFMSVCYFIISFLWMWLRRCLGYRQRYNDLVKRASSDKDLQKAIYNKIRRHPTEYNSMIPTAIGFVGVVVTGLAIWNTVRAKPEAGEIVKTDKKASYYSFNDFFSFSSNGPKSDADNSLTLEDTLDQVARNSAVVTTVMNGSESEITGTWTQSGILVVPRHFFKPDPTQDKLVDQADIRIRSYGGFCSKCRVYPNFLKRVNGKDAVGIRVPRAPKLRRGILNLFPTKTGTDHHSAVLLHGSERESLNVKYIENVNCGGYSCGRGVEYESEITRAGYCGSQIVRKGVIVGFHIAGGHTLTGKKIGYAQEILKSDIEQLHRDMAEDVNALTVPEAGPLVTERLGYKLIEGSGPHPATRMFEDIDKFNSIRVLGHNTKLNRYRSRVRPSLISDSFAEQTGIRNKWKKPDLGKPWIHHNKAIGIAAEGAWEVPPDALEWAFWDYLNPLLDALEPYVEEFPEFCCVLDEVRMVNGDSQSLFMSKLDMKTSCGPIGPGSGSKIDSGLFVEIEKGDRGEKRYALTPQARDHLEEMEKCFKSGVKYGVWSRTCLKDEVVEEDSEKVRIFYILECLFSLMVRKYYLPIIEFLSRHPTLSECAVGLNCAGPEWEQLMTYVQELATDGQGTDWDYSKYDLRRSPDVTMASMMVYRKIAQHMGYSEEALSIMDGIADELRNPTINWNGTIVELFLWSSGNSLTVYGGSSDNSLHNRCSFYKAAVAELGVEEFKKLGSFRDNERMCTYGDDGNSASKPSVRRFCNFSAKKRYFDSIGMKITDAAKTDNPRDSAPFEDIDFLKRKSVYHEALGLRLGALSLDSINKMAHMNSGSGDAEDLAKSSLVTMLLEAFVHGPEIYEKYRQDLTVVAKKHNLWTEYLDYDYSAQVARWKERYAQ
jgi:hypothetical protein